MTKHDKTPLQRLLAMLLCLVMVVGMFPVTANATESTENIDVAASGDAEVLSSESDAETVAPQAEEELDAVRLPITIRDAYMDNILFNSNFPNRQYDLVEPKLNDDGLPVYTIEAIRTIAGYFTLNDDGNAVINKESYTSTNGQISNPDLHNLLLNKMKTANWDSGNTATSVDPVNDLEGATSSMQVADWMLRHLFTDGTYTNVNGDKVSYTQTYPGYETLVLAAGKNMAVYDKTTTVFDKNEIADLPADDYGIDTVVKDCFYYDAGQSTIFHGNNGSNADTNEIKNGGTGIVANGGWHPLDGPETYVTNKPEAVSTDLNFVVVENPNALGLKQELLVNEATVVDKKNRYYEHNYHHTTVGRGQFVYHEEDDLFFQFDGDDDVYLFINGYMVINMGGCHGKQIASVWLEAPVTCGLYVATNIHNGESAKYGIDEERLKNAKDTNENGTISWAEYLGLEEGGIYSFDFFQMERNVTSSNFAIYTNIKIMDASAVPNKTAYLGSDQLAYGTMVMENAEVNYSFSLTNTSTEEKMAVTNMVFEDDMLGVSLSKDNIVLGKYTKINEDGSSEEVARQVTDLEARIYKYGETPPEFSPIDTQVALKELLKNGVAAGEVFEIRGFKYNVGTPDEGHVLKTIDNTVYVTVDGMSNNSTASRVIKGDASMRLSVGAVQDKSFVIDYAKELTISNADLFGTGDQHELTALGQNTTDADGNEIENTVGEITLNKSNGKYGTMTLNGDSDTTYSLTYKPLEFINGVDPFTLVIPVTSGSTTNRMLKDVNIIPANNVYYEDDFVSTSDHDNDGIVAIQYSGSWTESTTANEEHHEGAENATNGGVHGWEDSLADDATDSSGSSTKLTSSKTDTATATFTFTGCGVDIYSRTNKSSGTVMATLDSTDENVKISKTLFVDTLSESDEYYQIPTLSFMTYNDQPLPHGTYKVTIYVTTAAAGRFEYYLDGIRVYNPISNEETSTSTSISDAYGKEAYANFTEVRDLLIDANSFGTDAEGKPGAVFIDSLKPGQAPEGDNTEETTPTTTTNVVGVYKDYGPKNEVYLAAGQAITFKVDEGASVYHIGLKAPSGESTTVAFSKDAETNSGTTIAHASDLYYNVEPVDGYITVKNTGSNLLSVTKIKTAGTGAETANLVLLDITAEEAVNEVAAFSLRMTEPYSTEEDTPDVEIENPTETEKPAKPIISIVLQSQLKKMLQKLFDSLNGWFH